jgi:hypothetical protein
LQWRGWLLISDVLTISNPAHRRDHCLVLAALGCLLQFHPFFPTPLSLEFRAALVIGFLPVFRNDLGHRRIVLGPPDYKYDRLAARHNSV